MSKNLVVNPKIDKYSAIFDRDYFENGVATKKSNYKDIWKQRWGNLLRQFGA